MKSRNKILLVALLVLLLLVFLGYTNNQRGMNQVTGNVIKDVTTEEVDVQETTEPDDDTSNGSVSSTPVDPEPEVWVPPVDPEPEPEPEPEPQEEEGCSEDEIMYEGDCVEVACTKDEDCKTDDGCMPAKCFYPDHPNAYCADRITERIYSDGCCPDGAYMDVDNDCEPVCPNGRCEMGETTETCYDDCKNAGSPGTGDGGGDSGGRDGGNGGYET
jgi:hypothetical protein